MIMPIDIDKKEFTRDKRGYNSREVDEFLDLIVVDYEKVLNDNRAMAHKIKSLEKQLEEAQKSDTAMVETLQTAKKLMADISASAEKRAQLMIGDAQIEADNMVADAELEVKKLKDECELLKVKVARIRKNFRKMLETELAELDEDEYDLLRDLKDEEPEEEKAAPAVPAKTIVFNEPVEEPAKPVEEAYMEAKPEEKVEVVAPQPAVEKEPKKEDDGFSLLDEFFEQSEQPAAPAMPVTDLEHATISDLSESLKKMAEQPASLNDTIILK